MNEQQFFHRGGTIYHKLKPIADLSVCTTVNKLPIDEVEWYAQLIVDGCNAEWERRNADA